MTKGKVIFIGVALVTLMGVVAAASQTGLGKWVSFRVFWDGTSHIGPYTVRMTRYWYPARSSADGTRITFARLEYFLAPASHEEMVIGLTSKGFRDAAADSFPKRQYPWGSAFVGAGPLASRVLGDDLGSSFIAVAEGTDLALVFNYLSSLEGIASIERAES
ncbi:hypothetical protein BWI17_11335 [Betaproteobacteria bacterium GR16-43]|nr:hypothetical protein BWI17_11335 [Betaproteobacteria bacterium GR16-43]